MIIARRFNAGENQRLVKVPKGRLRGMCGEPWLWECGAEFRRPFGTLNYLASTRR
jgi:hypothetical protein